MITNASDTVHVAEMDCLTPLGDRTATHQALVAGRTALQAIPVLGAPGGEPVPLALLSDRPLEERVPPEWLASVRKMTTPVQGKDWGRRRRPVCVASSNFGVGSLYAYQQTRNSESLRYCTPERCVAWLREELGWGPHIAIFSHACVSSHIALLHASRLIWSGAADEVLVFSFDFLSPFVAGGFHALKILNSVFPAPYQDRDVGAIGLGDGAAYAVITHRRGTFEIVAQKLHNEMFHFTSNDPSGAGFSTLLGSLASASRKLWFKGHGTGTLEAGRLECEAVRLVMPDAPVVGWKGALGHTLGSCGLVELALAAEAIAQGITPGTVGSAAPTFTPQVALAPFGNREYDGVLCSSNAFGGAHAALVLRHV